MKYIGLQEHIRWCIEFPGPLWHFICGCKESLVLCVYVSGTIALQGWYLGHLCK